MPTTIAFSVGNTGPDRKTGTPTVDVSGTTMVFSVDQTGNIGIGDAVVYGGNTAYITAKQTPSTWTVRAANGSAPAAASGASVTSIKRVFATLHAALHSGSSGGAGWVTLAGLTNADAAPLSLVTNDLLVKIACYHDAVDASGSSIDVRSINGDATRYLWIGTPKDTATECNQSQYPTRLKGSGYVVTRQLQPRISTFIVFEGLEVDGTVNSLPDGHAETSSASCKWISCRAHGCTDLGFELHNDGELHNCISHHNARGIVTGGGSGSTAPRLHGCIAYGNSGAGYIGDSVDGIGDGCIGMANGGGDFLGSSMAGSSKNLVSSDASAPGTGSLINKTAYGDYFEDPANGDFTLKGTTEDGGIFGATGVKADGPATNGNVKAYDASNFSRAGASFIDVGPFEYDSGGPPPPPPSSSGSNRTHPRGHLRGQTRGIAV